MLEYAEWIRRERRIRTKIISSSPTIKEKGCYRVCEDCGEICLCHEERCPNCNLSRISERVLSNLKEDAQRRMRCLFRYKHLKEIMRQEGWMEKSVNNKPVLLYYEVLGFQKETMAHLDRHFNVKTLPNPDSDKQEALQDAVVIFAPMGFVFGKEKINQCPKLQIIGSPTTGLVHIDVEYAQEMNISICSLKDQQDFLSSITPTAELAWGLILSVVRKLPWACESVCEGKWNGKEFGKRTPKMISNMRLGVVGLGRLGSWVAKYGKAFKMDVHYFDPYVEDDRYIKCSTLSELAKVSDVVSAHVHLSKETENLIDRKFLQALPEGAFIVNTARGGIVNEDALLEALNSGHLGGAGLDMLAGEHLPEFKRNLADHPLVRYARVHDNLVLTPKMGGATLDAWAMTERRVVDLIIQELKRKDSLNGFIKK